MINVNIYLFSQPMSNIKIRYSLDDTPLNNIIIKTDDDINKMIQYYHDMKMYWFDLNSTINLFSNFELLTLSLEKPIELVFGETPETDTMDDVYDNSYFIDIRNENAAHLMFEINEYYGFFFPDSVGEWKFINEAPYAGDWIKN